jgi:hypothetical protein
MSDKAIVWVHGDCLRPSNPALLEYAAAPALFVFDDALLKDWRISLKRVQFMYECLLEMPVSIRRGDVAREVAAFAREHGATLIGTTDSPSPRFMTVYDALKPDFTIDVVPEAPFLDYDGFIDLKRFSRYWNVARKVVLK